jgi:hypothetical protein
MKLRETTRHIHRPLGWRVSLGDLAYGLFIWVPD